MQTLEAMLRPKVATLPGHIQAVYVQNAAKLFATVLKSQEGNTDSTAAQETSQLMIDRLPLFVQSANLEVQERVRCYTSSHNLVFFCSNHNTDVYFLPFGIIHLTWLPTDK